MAYLNHGRTVFFKYATTDTAIAVLESGLFRYSSPLLFNDPFDIQTELHYRFDLSQFPERLFAHLVRLVESDEEPVFVDSSWPWAEAILFFVHNRSSHGFPRAELESAMRPHLKHLAGIFEDNLCLLRKHRETLVPRLRVFSVTEDPANLLMWAHYSANHTGVVLELRVLPDEDNPLCVAEPVIYSSHVPSPFVEERLLDAILGLGPLEMDETCANYTRVKGQDWSYEKEWRVWDIAPNGTEGLFSPYSLRQKELAGIYFGCRIDSTKRQRLTELVRERFPDANTYQARKQQREFGLEFATAT